MSGDNLSASNFQEFAQKAIAKYGEKWMVIDEMLWSSIIGHYDKTLRLKQTLIDKLLAEKETSTRAR